MGDGNFSVNNASHRSPPATRFVPKGRKKIMRETIRQSRAAIVRQQSPSTSARRPREGESHENTPQLTRIQTQPQARITAELIARNSAGRLQHATICQAGYAYNWSEQIIWDAHADYARHCNVFPHSGDSSHLCRDQWEHVGRNLRERSDSCFRARGATLCTGTIAS